MIKCYGDKESKEERWARMWRGRGGVVVITDLKMKNKTLKLMTNRHTTQHKKTDNFITIFLNVYIVQNPINNQKP